MRAANLAAGVLGRGVNIGAQGFAPRLSRGPHMSYVSRVLLPQERIEARPKLSRMAQYGAPIIEFLASILMWSIAREAILAFLPEPDPTLQAVLKWGYLGGLAIFTVRFIWRFIVRVSRLWFHEIAVTNQRFMEKTGVLNVSFYSTDLEKIVRVAIDQPLLGRFFDYADVTIVTVGEVSHKTQGVAQPIALQQALHARMSAVRSGG